MDADGQNRQRLTTGNDPDLNPALSADGQTVFFVGLRNGRWTVRRINRDGSGEKELCTISRPSILDPSPDGKWIFFNTETEGAFQMFKVPVEGGEPIRVTQYPGVLPRLSPDGTQLAFLQYDKGSIATAPSDGGPPVFSFRINPTTYFTYHWTADGKAILHNGRQNDRTNIWLQPLSGGEPKQITHFDEQYVLTFDRTRNGDALIVVRGTLSRDAVLIKGF
jgi:TolB protein